MKRSISQSKKFKQILFLFVSEIAEFVNYTKLQSESYATSNLIMTMGEDFNYGNANMWFKNMDKLRNYFNENVDKFGIHIHYSTPSCYLKSIHETNRTWSLKTDDFMPYASDPHAYWSGYFTSRPALKGMIRSGVWYFTLPVIIFSTGTATACSRPASRSTLFTAARSGTRGWRPPRGRCLSTSTMTLSPEQPSSTSQMTTPCVFTR